MVQPIEQLALRALRHQPARAAVPRGRRPRFELRIERQPASEDARCPEPGTVTVDGDTAVLHACRRRHWPTSQLQDFADRMQALRLVVVVAHTQAAAEDTRKRINYRYRIAEAATSGLLPVEAAALLRDR